MKRRKQMLDIDLFKPAVDSLAVLGVTEMNLNVTIGDPLGGVQLPRLRD